MINFIPKAFTGEEDTCPVCIARLDLESCLLVEQKALQAFNFRLLTGGGCSERLAQQSLDLSGLFQTLLADYRVSFALNLGIWFAAERFGRTKKVKDLLLAYDEYREQSLASFAAFNLAVEELNSTMTGENTSGFSLELASLLSSQESLKQAVERFWLEVDKWTMKRREEAFKVL